MGWLFSSSANVNNGSSISYFLQTECDVARSAFVLSQALRTLHEATPAGQEGADKTALRRLSSRLNLRPVRNTMLIEIRGRAATPSEAARIADAVATAYQDFHSRQRQGAAQTELKALEQRLSEQERQVETAQKRVDELRLALAADLETAGQARPYWKARRDLEDLERFRQALFIKVASQREDFPLGPAVEIIDKAAPLSRPVSPNRPRCAGLTAAGFVMAALGFLMVRTDRRASRDALPA